jgi:hypothetical protein
LRSPLPLPSIPPPDATTDDTVGAIVSGVGAVLLATCRATWFGNAPEPRLSPWTPDLKAAGVPAAAAMLVGLDGRGSTRIRGSVDDPTAVLGWSLLFSPESSCDLSGGASSTLTWRSGCVPAFGKSFSLASCAGSKRDGRLAPSLSEFVIATSLASGFRPLKLFANLYVSSAASHPRKVKLNARYVLAKPNTEPHAARAS